MIRQAPSLLETLKEFITTKLKFGHQSGFKEENNRKNDRVFRRMIYLKIATKKIMF